ncbi:MAG: PepSY-associated TM helix domain-containing protein [Pseudomonadota bacterium]
MDRARHLRNYDLHSWSGLALGLFVYIVVFSGSVALFFHEVQSWEDPARRLGIAEPPIEMNAIFTNWIDKHSNGDPIEFLRFTYPTAYAPYYTGRASIKRENEEAKFISQRWDTSTGAPLPERGEGMSRWLLDFHRDLMWPDFLGGHTAGRTIVGIVGIILMLSIVTGVVAHTKITKELFTLRFFRSIRLKWQDAHKVLGLWGLPFYSMIAFTGAILGVLAIIAPLIAVLTFKGDQTALMNAVLGEPVEASGISAEMLSVDDLADLKMPGSNERVRFITMAHYGDTNARFDIYFAPDKELKLVEGYQINGVTGEKTDGGSTFRTSTATRVLTSFSPLHFGTYGGVLLKFAYFILGIMLSVITALGMMMWVERRRHGSTGSRPKKVYEWVSKGTAGTMIGLVIASAFLLCHDKVYTGLEEKRLFWTGITFFLVWFMAIGFAFFRQNEYAVTKELLTATALLLCSAVVLNAIKTNDTLLAIFGSGHKIAAYVDLSLVVLGLATIAVAAKLPKARDHNSNSGRRLSDLFIHLSLKDAVNGIRALFANSIKPREMPVDKEPFRK